VRWTNNATTPDGVVVERSENGGAYGNAVTLSATATSWTHSAPSTGSTWRYRVKATTSSPALSSAYALSNIVQLAAPPNAPTGLGPTTVHDATQDVTLHWTHNPVDSSEQTKFQVGHRVAAGGAFTYETAVESSVSEWVLPGGTYDNGVVVEWVVRTWGEHADPSPYSATATLPFSAPPFAAINEPEDGSTITTSALTVTWGYSDPEGTDQASWQVELHDDTGQVLESRSGAGTATSVTLSTAIPDGAQWSVQVRVRDSDGMWSQWDVSEFTVGYALPPVPLVELQWDPSTAAVAVQVANLEPGEGEVETDHVDVYRAIGEDGPWELIATGVPPNSTITDYAPTVTGINRYRVVAVSALPSVAEADPVDLITPQPGDVGSLWLSGGPGFSQVCRLTSNVQLSPAVDRAVRELRQFAGRTHPVEFTGQALVETWDVAGDIILGSRLPSSLAQDWLALGSLPGPFLLRTPALGGVYAVVSVRGMSTPREPGGTVTGVRFTATRVDRA